MNRITVTLPVVWKAVVTERLKQELASEVQRSIGQLDIELQQLEFQGKRLLPEMEKQSLKKAMELRRQLEEEKQKRRQAKEQLQARMREIQNLALNEEITRGTLDSVVELEVGMPLDSLLKREIVSKDGVIVEIREG